MFKGAENLIKYTREQIDSIVFRCTFRTQPQHFAREAKLNFANTMLIVLKMIKKSIKVESMDFFYDLNKNLTTPSRQAFSEAREKISYLAFKDFFDKSCEIALNNEEARLYKGYRIFAIDGTSFVIGALDKLASFFGKSTTINDKAMCRINSIVDVMNDSIVNAAVSPFSIGERALAMGQIEELKSVENALFLFDRGYWSPKLAANIINNGQKFVMRLASNVGKVNIVDENGNPLRRYSFLLSSGEKEELLTNISEDEMHDDELVALYAKRWGIETKYLELKDRLQIDKFSGSSVNSVLQDIYSTLYISNLVAFMCFESDEAIKEKSVGKNNKYEQKTNRSTCISTLRKRFIDICILDDHAMRVIALQRMIDDISKDVVYVGKSKSRPRNKRQMEESRKHKFRSTL